MCGRWTVKNSVVTKTKKTYINVNILLYKICKMVNGLHLGYIALSTDPWPPKRFKHHHKHIKHQAFTRA